MDEHIEQQDVERPTFDVAGIVAQLAKLEERAAATQANIGRCETRNQEACAALDTAARAVAAARERLRQHTALEAACTRSPSDLIHKLSQLDQHPHVARAIQAVQRSEATVGAQCSPLHLFTPWHLTWPPHQLSCAVLPGFRAAR